MEIFDLYDKSLHLLPNKMIRGEHNKQGEYHMVVHVWIKHNQKYLMQQRNKKTDQYPFQWASCGGAVTTGETSLRTAKREVFEEMGVDIDINRFQFQKHFFVENKQSNYVIALYLVEENIQINELTMQIEEVNRCAYFSLEEIKLKIKKKQCWRYEETEHTKDYFSFL